MTHFVVGPSPAGSAPRRAGGLLHQCGCIATLLSAQCCPDCVCRYGTVVIYSHMVLVQCSLSPPHLPCYTTAVDLEAAGSCHATQQPSSSSAVHRSVQPSKQCTPCLRTSQMNARAAEALSGCAGPSRVQRFQASRRRQTCSRHVTMSTATAVEFAKYQGLGNDFILVQKHLRCLSSRNVSTLNPVNDLTRCSPVDAGS